MLFLFEFNIKLDNGDIYMLMSNTSREDITRFYRLESGLK